MKKVLYVIIGIAAIYFILCLFGPSSIKFERSALINAPKELVQKQLADLKYFHEAWSPWSEKDPNAKITFTGENGQPGSVFAWDGNVDSVGKGSMTYEKTVGDSILLTLRFDGMGDSKVYYITKDSASATNVIWGMIFVVGLFSRAIKLFMKFVKMMAPDYEKGLKKLKASLEAMSATPDSPAYEIKEMQWEAKTFYGKKINTSFDKLSAFFGENYQKLGEAMSKAKIEPVGAPKAIFFTFDEKTMMTDVAAVMEIPADKKLDGFEKFESPAGKVLMLEYWGAYDKSGDAHSAMDTYIKKNNLTQGLVFEEYITSPMTEKDTAKWQTNIYYLVK